MASRGSQETVKRKELVGKLNPTCLQAFSKAAQAAKRRGNPYVELVHFVTELADCERSDFDILLQSAGVDRHKLTGDMLRATDALPHGAGSVEEFSPFPCLLSRARSRRSNSANGGAAPAASFERRVPALRHLSTRAARRNGRDRVNETDVRRKRFSDCRA